MSDTVPFTYPQQYAGWWFITAPNRGRAQRTMWVLNRFAVAATSSASVKAVARYGPQFRYVEARVYTSPRTRTRRPRRPAIHPQACGKGKPLQACDHHYQPPRCEHGPQVPRMPSLARPQHASQRPAFLTPFEAPQRQQEHIDELVSPW
ncbi:uncharacterized protein BXZ73DRAFT_103792 [Epithele typhae]|uniref:uncharacterized protein n=1 Tax=Epithele typhae TaxID=378194 RepID=UPI0020083E9C|nr:uncharacterized protein BXZ73DRAFT_103792 [Epithele typhae]KAH9923742.1 hypothetical protein BXZ73DRAFT_103792 [Epithele typhae]